MSLSVYLCSSELWEDSLLDYYIYICGLTCNSDRSEVYIDGRCLGFYDYTGNVLYFLSQGGIEDPMSVYRRMGMKDKLPHSLEKLNLAEVDRLNDNLSCGYSVNPFSLIPICKSVYSGTYCMGKR